MGGDCVEKILGQVNRGELSGLVVFIVGNDFANDYAEVRPRFLVEGTDLELTEWLRQVAELYSLVVLSGRST